VDRRLTSRVALALVSCALSACAIGPIWARGLEGRVVDAGTGQPVPGVEVFASYVAEPLLTGAGDVDFDYHFTTTDEQGHFAIPGHFASQAWRFLSWTRTKPDVWLLHRSYGKILYSYSTASYGLPEDWQNLELKIRPYEDSLRVLSKPENAGALCVGDHPDVCRRACVVWWGSLDVCEQYGVISRDRR
jgi:hypothetical protein